MIDLIVPNMNCGGCARAVTRACAAVDPQAKVDIDLSQKRVRIGSAQPREAFAAALSQAGYATA
jgi:copper chaperone